MYGDLMPPATIKLNYVYTQTAPKICPILTKFGFSRPVFIIKSPKSKFTKICPVAAELIQTQRHDEDDMRFSRVSERVYEKKVAERKLNIVGPRIETLQ